MSFSVSVVIGTFGDSSWADLARERALPSALDQAYAVHAHRDTLAEARNAGLASVETEWCLVLDADDELEPGYVEAMGRGTADVRGPMARYVRAGHERLWQPRVAGHTHDCAAECLRDGNWLLIGAAVRTELLRRAGGWKDYDWSEDYSTWIRCWKAGGTFELIPDAIYRAYVRRDSRNRGATREAKLAAHEQIHRDEFPELYEEAACG
jgi:glycosyltransferase involved in cell wall biosynthesis